MGLAPERVGPFGESLASAEYRTGIRDAARDALAAIGDYRRGAIDVARVCRTIVNDPYLREIAPIELLLGFIRTEAGFDSDEEPAQFSDEEPDEDFARESESIARDCDALSAHLELWQRDNPPASAAN